MLHQYYLFFFHVFRERLYKFILLVLYIAYIRFEPSLA